MHELTDADKEIIILTAACDLIDEMVNYSMFCEDWEPTWSNVLFRTAEHAVLFNIRLSDFLSAPQPSKATEQQMPFGLDPAKPQVFGSDGSFLFYLKSVSKTPTLASYSADLERAVQALASWLDGETIIKNAWFPTIQKEVSLRIPRHEALKITGNIGKHNFTRLAVDANKIKTIMGKHGIQLVGGQEYLILGEFQDWFHDHAFIYQSSHISEQLNTLRWEIYRYLKPIPFSTVKISENFFVEGQKRILEQLSKRHPPVPPFTVDQSFKTQLC